MKIYWYELTYRGISPGTFPKKDFFTKEYEHTNKRGFEFGAVAYTRQLTEKELEDYELEPIEAPRELFDFEEYLLETLS